MEGVVFGESPRWHDERLWFADWGANQVIALVSTAATRWW
jgi:sugar lactone lactonase YvrE